MTNGDFKNFSNFKKTHKMSTNKCDHPGCEGQFTRVELKSSSRDVLFVRCSDKQCDKFILARRK